MKIRLRLGILNFIEWLYEFPMPDGQPAKTIWPGLIAALIIEILMLIPIILLCS